MPPLATSLGGSQAIPNLSIACVKTPFPAKSSMKCSGDEEAIGSLEADIRAFFEMSPFAIVVFPRRLAGRCNTGDLSALPVPSTRSERPDDDETFAMLG